MQIRNVVGKQSVLLPAITTRTQIYVPCIYICALLAMSIVRADSASNCPVPVMNAMSRFLCLSCVRDLRLVSDRADVSTS